MRVPMVGNKIAGYTWDFGDGTTNSGRQTTHVYGKSGSYTVKLTVYDCMGNTATISQTLFLCFGGYFATFATSLLGPKV